MSVTLTFGQYSADPARICWNPGVVWRRRAHGRQSSPVCSPACTWHSRTQTPRGHVPTLSPPRVCHRQLPQPRRTFPTASQSRRPAHWCLHGLRNPTFSTQPTNKQLTQSFCIDSICSFISRASQHARGATQPVRMLSVCQSVCGNFFPTNPYPKLVWPISMKFGMMGVLGGSIPKKFWWTLAHFFWKHNFSITDICAIF